MFRRDPSRRLGERLVKLRLISQSHYEQARQLADDKSAAALIEALERKQFITNYQAGKLRTEDFETLVLGDYRLTYQNAAGSFARVFRAESISSGRIVALKLLRSRHASSKKEVIQFFREARLVQAMDHKNIVPIFDIGSEGESHYFTMEFVEGGNLRDFLAVRKKLSPAEATRYVRDIAAGLAFAFNTGVTHRDLKLSNVLITTRGVAKLVDFGLAGQDLPGGGADQRAIEYATLEKATGVPHDDARSDLFFLGGIFYELLTGKPPWPYTRDRAERKQVSRYRDVPSLVEVDPDLPPRVVQIVDKLMAWDPRERYQSARDALADLEQALPELGGEEMGPDALGPLPGADDPEESPAPSGRPAPTILFVEPRSKRQELLKDYFQKRGFRPIFLTSTRKAVLRLESDPPDAVVFMAPRGTELPRLFSRVQGITQEVALVAVFVLPESKSDIAEELAETAICRVLTQPVILREMRRQLQLGMKEILSQSRLIKLPPIPEFAPEGRGTSEGNGQAERSGRGAKESISRETDE